LPSIGMSLRDFFMGSFIGFGVGFIPVMVIEYLAESRSLLIPPAVAYALFFGPQLAGGLISAYLTSSRSTKNPIGIGVLTCVVSLLLYMFIGVVFYGIIFGGSFALIGYLAGGTTGGFLRDIRSKLRRK
jgi:hypothetical protein